MITEGSPFRALGVFLPSANHQGAVQLFYSCFPGEDPSVSRDCGRQDPQHWEIPKRGPTVRWVLYFVGILVRGSVKGLGMKIRI